MQSNEYFYPWSNHFYDKAALFYDKAALKAICQTKKDCCILGTIERERKEQKQIAFDYLLETNRKAYEAVRQAGGGDIEHGLKIMQAMHNLEKTIRKQDTTS